MAKRSQRGPKHSPNENRYDKYKTNNLVVKKLIDGFFAELRGILLSIKYESLLDAGCGDGEGLVRLADLLPSRVVGVDNDEQQIARARERLSYVNFSNQDIYHLPYASDSFDVVLALEVLEHLDKPSEGLMELVRVSSKYVIFSVPHEPFFRIGNLIRGKNIARFGNDLDHVNHWGKRSFRHFMRNYVQLERIQCSFPWLIGVGVKHELQR